MEDIIRRQRATIEEHIREENAHNWPAVYNTFVQDETAFYDVVPLHTHFAGLTGVKDFYQAAHQAFPDFTITVWGEYDLPGCSVREVTIAGTHQGDWCEVPGTGRRWWQLSAMEQRFAKGANSLPGSGWCRANIPPAANKTCSVLASEVMDICGGG